MSGTFHHLQANFNVGALSPRLQSRTDLPFYGSALAAAVNLVATIEGPIVKRPGTRYRAPAMPSARWLTPFVYSATQGYVCVWGERRVEFLTNGAPVMDGAAPYGVAVPYTAAEAQALSIEQSYDVLYLAHPAHVPATLSRTSATTFAHANLALKGGPFGDRNRDEAVTVSASGTTGSVTLTASAAIWKPGHAGGLFRIEANDFSQVPAWQAGMSDITAGTLRRAEGRVYEALSSGRTGNIIPTHIRGSEWDGSPGKDINDKGPYGVLWRYRHDRFGIVQIDSVAGGGTSASATVYRRLPDDVTQDGSWRWAHGLFSDAEGWPSLVIRAWGRLLFIKGRDLVGSVVGAFRDFSEFDDGGDRQVDMAFRRTLDLADAPLWVRPDRQNLLIGTLSGEYMIGPRNNAEPVSGTNIVVVPQSRHGSAAVPPLQTATETLFVQRGRVKVRGNSFDFGQDRYVPRNVTMYARHLAAAGIRQLAYQAEPEELLWALREDGTLIAHPYAPSQDVKGWTEALAMEGARVRSIVTIPSPDGWRDELYLLVERGTAMLVEQLGEWWNDDIDPPTAEAYHVDCGLTYRGPPVTGVSGLDHLKWRTVALLADGAVLPPQVVGAQGRITLERPASIIHAGLPFTARLVTLPPEVPRRDGTGQGRHGRIVKLKAKLLAGLDVLAGALGAKLERVAYRDPATPMGQGSFMRRMWSDTAAGAGNGIDPQAVFEDASPLPLIIPAIKTELKVGD